MNALDYLLLGLALVSVVTGLIKGFVKELFSLIGVVLAVLLALLLSPEVGIWLERWIGSESAAYAAALIAVFLLTLLLVALLGRITTKVVELAQLGFVNRLLGGGFGFLRALGLGRMVLLGRTLVLDANATILAESRLAPFFVGWARLIAPLLPEGPRTVLLHRVDDLPETVI